MFRFRRPILDGACPMLVAISTLVTSFLLPHPSGFLRPYSFLLVLSSSVLSPLRCGGVQRLSIVLSVDGVKWGG